MLVIPWVGHIVQSNFTEVKSRPKLAISKRTLKRQVFNHQVNIRRSFSTSSKVNSVFTDWPHIRRSIKIISDREIYDKRLWECDYSFLTSAILPYYFPSTQHSAWIITPEFNYLEGNHPDYTIFKWSNRINNFGDMIHAVVEVKSKRGDSWHKLLEQMYSQADVAKNNNGRLTSYWSKRAWNLLF